MASSFPPSLGVRHIALGVLDLPRALAFYSKHLGFTPYHTSDRDWAMLRSGATTLSLIVHPHPPDLSPQGVHPAHFGLNAPNPEAVHAWHRSLSANGLTGLTEPRAHRDGTYGFYMKDSEGNTLEIISIPQLPDTQEAGTRYVLLAHGSTDRRWVASLERLLAKVKEQSPGRQWHLAHMEFAEPNLSTLAATLASEAVSKVRVVPVFLASGGHVTNDLPALLSDARRVCPRAEWEMTPALGESPAFSQGACEGIFELLGL